MIKENSENLILLTTLLILVSIWMIFYKLGVAPLWKPEGRVAEVVREMFIRHDFLHPTSGWEPHVTKPIIPYWLDVIVVHLTGKLNELTLRIPSAIGAVIAIVTLVLFSKKLLSSTIGIISALLLLTSYGFILWARCAAADILNLSFILITITWYWWQKDKPSIITCFIFGILLALSGQMKGLVGVAIPTILILIDILYSKKIKEFLKISILLPAFIGFSLYFLIFLLSSLSAHSHGFNWISRAIHESFGRFFHPFDHKGPWWLYIEFISIWLIPWSIIFLYALFSYTKNFKKLDYNRRWLLLSVLAIFLLFTASGSRRSYYILPILPFSTIIMADVLWEITNKIIKQQYNSKEIILLAIQTSIFLIISITFILSKTFIRHFLKGLDLPSQLFSANLVSGILIIIPTIIAIYGLIKIKKQPQIAKILLIAILVAGFFTTSGVFCLEKPIVDKRATEKAFILSVKTWLVAHPNVEPAYFLVGARPRTRLSFYLNLRHPVTVLRNKKDLRQFLSEHSSWIIICVRQDEKTLLLYLNQLKTPYHILLKEKRLPWEGYPNNIKLINKKKYIAFYHIKAQKNL